MSYRLMSPAGRPSTATMASPARTPPFSAGPPADGATTCAAAATRLCLLTYLRSPIKSTLCRVRRIS